MKGEYSDLLSGYLNKEKTVSKARFFDKWPYVTEKKSVTKSAEEKRKELENEDYAQDIKLKKKTLNRLFWFLGIESLLIFIFTWYQATHWLNFSLEEWSFKLLLSSTILQITYMLQMAIKYLFPNKDSK
ncbi:MAG: hypothetical protein HOE80_01125 [Candidatus Magasanikbacteria bacterium]|nr:hypothetical protein [Candidatus Magasanikbacteria bacterium]MBT4071305.1 hypothetical protein [Candidatus Magasanikbacteria bacterium]